MANEKQVDCITPREKMTLEPGVHYRGSFWINDYGEFSCHPEQTGSRPGGGSYSLIWDDENYSLYESKNFYKAIFKLPKKNLSIVKIRKIVTDVITRLADYID